MKETWLEWREQEISDLRAQIAIANEALEGYRTWNRLQRILHRRSIHFWRLGAFAGWFLALLFGICGATR